ncbi:hypothetical protein [Streptomyces sp. 142MFCol3.1]|uniref:hypothetical protein n=1 Tax=Streptomyces sp. 142MFCol3.1 TaxID=1172179 RepID=UPI00131A0A43|nr:hypothetical protein [Streptomyces sp. 142MFCol3.1]
MAILVTVPFDVVRRANEMARPARATLTERDNRVSTHVTGLIPSPPTAEYSPGPPNPFHP